LVVKAPPYCIIIPISIKIFIIKANNLIHLEARKHGSQYQFLQKIAFVLLAQTPFAWQLADIPNLHQAIKF